jgi:DNA-directed RNA polymerase specialized sigma24 family protein
VAIAAHLPRRLDGAHVVVRRRTSHGRAPVAPPPAIDRARPTPRPAAPELAAEPHQLLALLDADRRTAIVLTQLLGLSYAEAAEICECAVGTIRSRVARAREELVAASTADGTARRRAGA